MLENVLQSSRDFAVILGVGFLERSRRFDNVRELSKMFETFGG